MNRLLAAAALLAAGCFVSIGDVLDLENDRDNCGEPGHRCGGGACKAGVCQPFTVAANVGSMPGLLALDSSRAYWVTEFKGGSEAKVWSAPLDAGAEPSQLACLGGSSPHPGDLAVDATHVYVFTHNFMPNVMAGRIVRILKQETGCLTPMQMLVDGLYAEDRSPGVLALDDTRMYVTTGGSQPAIRSYAKDGTDAQIILRVGNAPSRLAFDATGIYWLMQGPCAPGQDGAQTCVSQIEKKGGTSRLLSSVRGAFNCSGLLADDENVFASCEGGAPFFLPKRGDVAKSIGADSTVWGLEGDAGHVYWLFTSSSMPNQVRTYDKRTKTDGTVATLPPRASWLASNERLLCWIAAGALSCVAKLP